MNPSSLHPLHHPRIIAYLLTALLLGGSGIWLRGSAWQGGAALHTLMEALATLLALYVGTLALIRYFSQREGQFLYIGAGFIGTAVLDGYHALVTSTFFQPYMPSENTTLVPWSWLASRLYLAVLMVLSWLLWLIHRDRPDYRPNHRRVFAITALTTLATFLLFGFSPLPNNIHPGALFPRPYEMLPGILFLVALAGYLHKGKWRTDSFEHWLVLSLIVGAALQISFMSFSGALYDLEFDVAHLLKKASYILVLIGLMVNLREAYAQIKEQSHHRRQAEEEAQRGRRQLFSILEGLPGFVFLVAPDHSIRFANRYFREHFGPTEGAHCYRSLTRNERPCEDCPTVRVFATGVPEVWESAPLRDGKAYQIHAYPLADEDGQPLVLELGIDISLRQQAEQELKRSNADLEQFAYAVSHDMRQPLRMVASYLQLVEKALHDRLDDDTRQYLAYARDGAQRMDGMILALLDFSRVGRKTAPLAPLAIRSTLEEALAFLGPELQSTGGTVAITGEWPTLVASRDEMVRLFQNLIGNALKYHEADQPPQVAVHGQTQAAHWRCEVRDSGIGIDPTQIDRLFKVFSRLQARSRFDGAGVGLALCRRIIEHHGGSIGVSSSGEGQGSTFWFELPLTLSPATAAEESQDE